MHKGVQIEKTMRRESLGHSALSSPVMCGNPHVEEFVAFSALFLCREGVVKDSGVSSSSFQVSAGSLDPHYVLKQRDCRLCSSVQSLACWVWIPSLFYAELKALLTTNTPDKPSHMTDAVTGRSHSQL